MSPYPEREDSGWANLATERKDSGNQEVVITSSVRIRAKPVGRGVQPVQNGGMIATTQGLAGRLETTTANLPEEQDGKATCPDDASAARGSGDVARANTEVTCRRRDDATGGDRRADTRGRSLRRLPS